MTSPHVRSCRRVGFFHLRSAFPARATTKEKGRRGRAEKKRKLKEKEKENTRIVVAARTPRSAWKGVTPRPLRIHTLFNGPCLARGIGQAPFTSPFRVILP